MIYIVITICSLLSSIQALECPAGTEQVGGLNADIGGCGLFPCNERYQNNYQNIQDCSEVCLSIAYCKSFTWAPMNGDRNHQDKSACTLYNSAHPNQIWGPEQIMCKPLWCPSGSHRIGGLNTDIVGCGLQSCDARYDLATIEQCQQRCAANGNCVSFSWTPTDGDKNHAGKKVCTIYDTIVPNQVWGPNEVLCKKTVPVLTQGRPALISGDPHYVTFNGVSHNFQGHPTPGGQQFYLSTSCDINDKVNQPFSVLGEFRQLITYPITSLNYITIALYDHDETYYVYGTTAPNSNKYGKESNGDTTLFDPSAAGLHTYNVGKTNIGSMFQVEYIVYGWNHFRIIIYIDDDNDITTPPCVVNIYMIYQGKWTHPTYGEYRMHHFEMKVPECYRDTTCGLLGDFQTPWGQPTLLTCDGSRKDYTGARGWYPQADGYDPSGWTWNKETVDAHCRASPAVMEGDHSRDCSDAVKGTAILKCQEARDNLRQACYVIGGNYCNDLQTDCEEDVCVMGTVTPDRMDEFVEIEFTAAVIEEAQNNPGGFGPVPMLLYEFDGDLDESISDKDSRYRLQTVADARVGEGVLYCDGTGDFAYSSNNLDFGFESHSLEVLAQISNLDFRGGGYIALDSHYETDGDYSHRQFDSIVYNEIDGNKKNILGSDYFRRTDMRGERSRGTPGTRFDGNNYISETVTDEFLHFVAVYDVEQQRAKLYRNGIIQLDYQINDFMTREPNSGVRAMFCQRHLNADANDFAFAGKIRFGAVYNYALSGDDVAILLAAKVNNDFEHPIEVIGEELKPGRSLHRRQALVSNNGMFILRMQMDNNLCVYRLNNPGFQFTWGTMTDNTAAEYLKYNEDGSIALYDINGGLVRELEAANNDAGRLIMQTDGNFVAYSGNGVPYYDSQGRTAAKSSIFNFDFIKNANGVVDGNSIVMYLVYIIGILLTLNIICLTISCYKKGNKNKYKMISVESTDMDTDAEEQILVK
eukprot:236879_1